MIVCGVDEAGRGSMVGPLVVAGIAIERSKIKTLEQLGVRDSKKLTPASRRRLYRQILNLADDYAVFRISPKIIDMHVARHQLNHLEALYMARIIKKLGPHTSYVDSCDVNASRFGKELEKLSNISNIKAYHHADAKFLVVSAASIIAKVTRDRAIEKLAKSYSIGSGYPSDSRTITCVRNCFAKTGKMPDFVRKSWAPAQKIANYQAA
ncbi:ribonuclease HII [Candidatus Nitrosotenuis uzonensis]|uniref:Ribonuclease HII n=1 Tax=Candidatus Nitrosotenuis uzonensis TaxID=1407055 RepID=V6AUD9_9ARCH|nr:ribonuclease HII [Candidatus Nitrosotenuis uzonensis]CDI06093.1 Ribonuclease HII [Candidatus Nitrosotenuis uzonensis]